MEQFSGIWSEVPGSCHEVMHELKLGTEKPVHVQQYPLPLTMQAVIEKEVAEMLNWDIIDRSMSAYHSPLVVVKK